MPPSTPPCLSLAELERLAQPETAPPSSKSKSHLETCSTCRNRLEDVRAELALFDECRQFAPELKGIPAQPTPRLQVDAPPPETLELRKTLPATSPTIEGYTILRELHRGGQGIVYEALQTSTRRKVAIKVLLEGAYASPAAQKRFEREIELVASLKHPNIISIFHSGITQDRHPFYVMDYIRGLPLNRYVQDNKLAVEDILKLFAKVAQAVSYAHQKGIIHRDLKPSNILVDVDGDPRVLDFGLAKTVGGPEASLVSITGQIIGTLQYMSPEQVRGNPDEIDTRTDVYALGIILYEALTGQYPYPVVGPVADVFDHILNTPPKPPTRAWRPESGVTLSAVRKRSSSKSVCPIGDEVQTILLKALAKERERRYQSLAEFAEDIARYLAGQPIHAKGDSTFYILKKTVARYRVAFAAAAAFVIVVVVALVISLGLWRAAVAGKAAAEAANARAQTEFQKRLESERETAVAETEAATAQRLNYLSNIRRADDAFQQHDAAKMLAALNACPTPLRHWEWRHLRSLVDSSSRTFAHHAEWVTSVAVSPDGLHFVSAAGGASLSDFTAGKGELFLCEMATGERIRKLQAHPGPVLTAEYSPDGKFVASAGWFGQILLWPLEPPNQPHRLIGVHPGPVAKIAFRPDGRQIATAGLDSQALLVAKKQRGIIKLWNLDGPQPTQSFPLQDGWVWAIAYAPDGARLATAGGFFPDARPADIKIWNPDTAELIATLNGHDDTIRSLRFSPDGQRLLSAGFDAKVKIWDLNTNKETLLFDHHRSPVWSAAFNPDGQRVVSASMDKDFLTTGVDNTIRVWDAKTGEEFAVLAGHQGGVGSAAFTTDGKQILSGSFDQTVKLWDIAPARQATPILVHDHNLRSLAYSADGNRLLSGSFDKTAKLIDVDTGSVIREFRGHENYVNCALFLPDHQRIATASSDKTIRLWEIATGREIHAFSKQPGEVMAIAASPDGKYLASGGMQEYTIRIWSLDTYQFVKTLPGHDDLIQALTFARDGKWLISGSRDKSVRICDVDTSTGVRTLNGHQGQVNALALSPDGKRFASASADRTAKIWDLDSGQEVRTLVGHNSPLKSIVYAPDGKRLFTGSGSGIGEHAIKIWDVDTGDEILTLWGHTNNVESLAISPDGKTLASGSYDKSIKLWPAP